MIKLLNEFSGNPLVSIIIVTYNNRNDIEECLDSILNQTYKNFEIIIVDNSSTDGTPDIIQKKYPLMYLIKSSKNLGYAGGNALGLKYARGDYIVVLNPDTVVDKDWLQELVRVANMNHRIGIVGACILLYDQPDRINALGNTLHFTGLVFCNMFYELYSKYKSEDKYLVLPSGASFLVKRQVINDVGFMDKLFFMEFSDTDFIMRAISRGWKCVVNPRSRAYHKYRLKMTPLRFYILERGRYILLMKNFSKKLLAIFTPGLILTELLTWIFGLISGRNYLASKILAIKWILKNRKYINIKRTYEISTPFILNYLNYEISISKQLVKYGTLRQLIILGFNFCYWILFKIPLTLFFSSKYKND